MHNTFQCMTHLIVLIIYASCNDGAKETLELLLTHPDIDPLLRNDANETAYDLALRHGRCSYLFEVVEDCIRFKLRSR